MLTLIANAFRRWLDDRRDRALLRRLLQKPDRELEDIGLTRGDIENALEQPYGVRIGEAARRGSRQSLRFPRFC